MLLLEEWEKLCCYFSLIESNDVPQEYTDLFGKENIVDDGSGDYNDSDEANGKDEEVFEIEKILGLYYGNPKKIKKKKNTNYILRYLNFKPHLKVICGRCLLSMLFRTCVSVSPFKTHVNSVFD